MRKNALKIIIAAAVATAIAFTSTPAIADSPEWEGVADEGSSVASASASSFSDVNGKTAHREEILWLAESGISEGWKMSNGTRQFRPYANVARADMAALLFRLARSWGAVKG